MASSKTPTKPEKRWRMPESCDEILREVHSWDDLRKSINALGNSKSANKKKGDVFERFVQFYLQCDPAYQLSLDSVMLYHEVSVNLKRDLNLTDQDRGVDLIAKTKNGEYWGIQAKYRSDESGSMTLTDVSTFIAQVAGITKNITRGIVCASKREKNRDCETASSNIQQILLDTWETRPDEFWANVRQAAAHKKVEPLEPYEPDPHQTVAVSAAKKHFLGNDNRRGKLIMPCGTGKSLMGYWTAIKALKAKTVVVVVPSLDLIRQTFSVWAREAVAEHKKLDVLIVCSDKSTGSGDTHVDDLAAPVETHPEKIRKWLKSPQGAKALRVVFVTYQSGKVFADAAGSYQFDVGLFDEAHKTAGFEGKRHQHLLHQKNLKIRHRVFMTATERYYEGESDEVVGMNDKRLYGERYHYMSFGEAIYDGILADYSVVLLAVPRSEVEKFRPMIEERMYVDANLSAPGLSAPEQMTAEDLATAVALRKAFKKYKLSHAVSFHSRNKLAKEFVAIQEALNGVGLSAPLNTYRVSSELNSGRRHQELQGFEESKRALISNARCLTEGVDVPGINLVLFAQPRQSKVDIVQAVGRALRVPRGQPGKRGYVLVPVLVDDGNLDLEEIVDGTGFENLVSVVKAMATVDEDITERITVVLGKGARKAAGRNAGDTSTEVAPGRVNLDQFAEALRLRAWDRVEGLLKSRLSEEQILRWVDAHHERTGEWPRGRFGDIPEAPGETWKGIDSALTHGFRRLPGGSSLAQLLQEKRGVRNEKTLSDLTEEQILIWADAHHKRTGKWPNINSGKIPEAPGEKWGNIDSGLHKGIRNLPGDSSLAQLLEENRNVRNRIAPPPLSEKQIVKWAEACRKRTGKWPGQKSGDIPEAPGETWSGVNTAMHYGQRTLLGGSSLAKLLEEKCGVRNEKNLPDLTEEQILIWVDTHYERTEKWPTRNSGEIAEAPGETWARIDTHLFRGGRNLPGDSSLAQLLEEKRGVRNVKSLPDLTEEQLLKWADAFHARTGKWPGQKSGNIPEAPGEKWANINAALVRGGRNLPVGSSLAQLLQKKRGVRYLHTLSDLTEEQILIWADAHHKRTGKWPTRNSGEIPEAPGEKWANIEGALYKGLRNLPSGSSLAQLLEEKCGVRNEKNLPDLTEELIFKWAEGYKKRTEKWPTRNSGEIPEASNEKWSAVYNSLYKGQRNLPGGTTLAKLIAKHRK